MNNFLTHILIQDTIAEYEIYQKGEHYKALLIINRTSGHLPLELVFWKEQGRWRTSQMLTEHVLYQFTSSIDNHLLFTDLEALKTVAAA